MNELRIRKVAAKHHDGDEFKTAEHHRVTLDGADIGQITKTSGEWVWRHSNEVFGLTEGNLRKIANKLAGLNA